MHEQHHSGGIALVVQLGYLTVRTSEPMRDVVCRPTEVRDVRTHHLDEPFSSQSSKANPSRSVRKQDDDGLVLQMTNQDAVISPGWLGGDDGS